MPDLTEPKEPGRAERLARFLDAKLEEARAEALQYQPSEENLVLFSQIGQTVRNLEALRESLRKR